MAANIPKARAILAGLLAARILNRGSARVVQQALSLMTRASPVTRTPAKRATITPGLRLRVRKLALEGKSHHEIAELTGLRNQGRVSEILNGKR